MLRWHLNAVLLHHVQRFFFAARQALTAAPALASTLSPQNGGKTLTFFGNLLWAKSPYVTNTPEEEENMALLGAMLGTFGDDLIPTEDPTRPISHALDQLEQELMAHWDTLLTRLEEKLPSDPLTTMTPKALNEAVWVCVFPSYEYSLHQEALKQAIINRLLQQIECPRTP